MASSHVRTTNGRGRLFDSVLDPVGDTPCCGISSGATFGVAMRIADKAQPGSVILAMLPDTGERYLTTPLFEGIPEDMDDEERAISRSTPGYQMP